MIHTLLEHLAYLPGSRRRAAWLTRASALFGLALVTVTWRLWTPQHVFPQVPLFYWAGALPDVVQWIGLAAMVLTLAVVLVLPDESRWRPRALLAFVASTALMVLLDQERFQPWAYQLSLVALVLALTDARSACSLLRLLVIGFYFHSALSKLDVTFLDTLGQQFLSVLAGQFGVKLAAGTAPLWLAAVFPLGELLVALALCFRSTRIVGLGGAILLHVLLLAILGPWGLDHKPGVLIWNLFFIVQDVLLFSGARWLAVDELPGPERGLPRLATGIILAATMLPLLSPFGWFDVWPSWGLYASSSERVALLVHRLEVEKLPAEVQPFLVPPADANDPWMTLRLDRWCLAALGAPIYLQSRYQLGVAQGVIERYRLGNRARVVRFGTAGRFSGERRTDVYSGLPQLLAAQQQYWLNARPRKD